MNTEEIKASFVQLELPVQWGDMDAASHVNNTIYLKWVETARLVFFEKLQNTMPDFRTIGPILGWQDCKYIFPVTYQDTIVVTYDLTAIKMDRILCRAKLYSKKHQKLVAKANNSLIPYNYEQLKKVAIPKEWLKQLKEFYDIDVDKENF